jgi:hypothetical protein
MSQDHTNYNMSLISVQVKGTTNLEASAEVTCPESGNVIGHLSLRQTLLKYLKLHDGNPMRAELHQRGPQGPVDMVIPNTQLSLLLSLLPTIPPQCDLFDCCVHVLVPRHVVSP